MNNINLKRIHIRMSRRHRMRFLLLIDKNWNFGVKSRLFKFVFELEDIAKRKSWVNEYFVVGLNSIWTISSICCIIFEGVVRGLISFGFVKSFNSHWPPWIISFHLSFLGTKICVLLGLYCNNNVSSLTY